MDECNISQADLAWIADATRAQLQGARIVTDEGSVLFTPDGNGHYRALWTRDFAYMIEQAWDLFDPAEVRSALALMLSGQRQDGCMPDRVNTDGTPFYSPGGDEHPLADHALDNGSFAALAVCTYVRNSGDTGFFREVEPSLRSGLEFLARDAAGLVWNDPGNLNCPYGFTDTVAKSGYLLGCSL